MHFPDKYDSISVQEAARILLCTGAAVLKNHILIDSLKEAWPFQAGRNSWPASGCFPEKSQENRAVFDRGKGRRLWIMGGGGTVCLPWRSEKRRTQRSCTAPCARPGRRAGRAGILRCGGILAGARLSGGPRLLRRGGILAGARLSGGPRLLRRAGILAGGRPAGR